MAKTMTRVRLTRGQKKELRDHHQEHPEKSLRVLCKWAYTTFQLRHPPAHSTLIALFKSSGNDDARSTTTKTNRRVTSPQLESELAQWIARCESAMVPLVTYATIREKAMKIREDIVNDVNATADNALLQLSFSNGWLQKFLLRHGLKSRRLHGEAASVSAEVVECGRIAVQSVTAGYAKRDTFNMDETAFFYCVVPNTSVTKNNIFGRKNVKKRLTVALASNADGSFKLPLLFVGTARQPRCFKGKKCEELGVDYVSAPKGWMNTQLFRAWVNKFNEAMQGEARHVLLLLDNASCHRIDEQLSNVRICMLPPNTTAHLQPQDAGIIRSFKAHVNRLKNRHYIDAFDDMIKHSDDIGKKNVDEDFESLFHVDILVAMQWAQQAWEAVTKSTVANCWRHTGVIDEGFYELVQSMEKLSLDTPII